METDLSGFVPYSEKLKNPKWQKLRLEVMQRSRFTCEDCGSTDKSLQVHHRWYRKGCEPWDYKTSELLCLCEECHQRLTESLANLKKLLGLFLAYDIDIIYGLALGIGIKQHEEAEVYVENYEVAQGIGLCFGLSAEQVIKTLREGKITGLELIKQADPRVRENAEASN